MLGTCWLTRMSLPLSLFAWIALDKQAVGIILLVCLNFHDLDFTCRQTLCSHLVQNFSGLDYGL